MGYLQFKQRALKQIIVESEPPSNDVKLQVERYYSDNYVGSTLYNGDDFIQVEVLGTGTITAIYDGVTKTATATSTTPAKFYYGKYTGVDDGTADSGEMVISGDVISFTAGKRSDSKTSLIYVKTILSVTNWGTATEVGNDLFRDNTTITSLTLPDTITKIGTSAFYGCTNLTSITIPSSVTSIGTEAFSNARSLTEIDIPSGVTTIGAYTFYGAEALTSITIPNTVTSIENSAFSYTGLTSITIPSSVTSIGLSAFLGANLTSIVIPNSVLSIGQLAFRGCGDLVSVVLPSGITSIDNYVFQDCNSLTSLTIPSSVTSIGNSAFLGMASTTNKATFTISPTTPPTLGTTAFTADNVQSIIVPTASLSAYQSATNWSTYASLMVGG